MNKVYSKDGSEPKEIPERILLSDGRTRTDSTTFTAEEIADAGYIEAPDKPIIEPWQKVHWDGSAWVIENKDLSIMKTVLNNKINDYRDHLIYSTKTSVLSSGTEIPVDMRPNTTDMQNLSAFVQKATIRKLNDQADMMAYKGADNNLYMLTPDEAIEMGEAVFQEIENIYTQSWIKKQNYLRLILQKVYIILK